MLALLCVMLTTSVTNAAPHGKNAKISASHAAQIEVAYQKYLLTKKVAKKKAAPLKISYSPKKNRAKAKVAFSPKTGRAKKTYSNSLRVTATAYTSHVAQTDSTPNIAAWGDRLRPGMKVIAVSRDLLKEYGLKHGQKVRIKGLEGEYAVLDKMNKRWRKKIDIYMGMNKRKAFKWGRRKVEIYWNS